MDSDKAIEAIKQITTTNGYAFTPSLVLDKPSEAMRSVTVSESAGDCVVCINADGLCRDSLKTSITELLGDAVTFADETKPTPEVTEDNPDATTKKTANASRKSRKHNRHSGDSDSE